MATRKTRQYKLGRLKAKEIYAQRKSQYRHSILGIVENMSFAERYLL